VPETLFISDLHLAAARPGVLHRCTEFLGQRARTAQALYILGDLFDAWVGDDDDSPLARQVREALQALTGHGVPVYLQHGNRDFLLGERFCAQTGCRLLDEETVIALAGEPTLLLHGDLLCSDDHDYQQARQLLRSPAFVQDFLAKPLEERTALAVEYRRRSGEATSLKAEDIMDANPETVRNFMQRHGVQRLIHGHTHRQAVHQLQFDGAKAYRYVLGDWSEDQGSVLVADQRGLRFEAV
jgi:UDP-2,3-diacylglucosamine hydrolase